MSASAGTKSANQAGDDSENERDAVSTAGAVGGKVSPLQQEQEQEQELSIGGALDNKIYWSVSYHVDQSAMCGTDTIRTAFRKSVVGPDWPTEWMISACLMRVQSIKRRAASRPSKHVTTAA